MRTLKRRDAPPGRQLTRCQSLAYSGSVETLRGEVGRKIKYERRRLGFRSQEAFAAAIGKHETSVGNAERGSDRVGDGVYNAIEVGLGWPLGSIEAYLAGKGEPPWTLAERSTETKSPLPPYEWSAQARQRVISMSVDEVLLLIQHEKLAHGEEAAERILREIVRVREEARAIRLDTEAR